MGVIVGQVQFGPGNQEKVESPFEPVLDHAEFDGDGRVTDGRAGCVQVQAEFLDRRKREPGEAQRSFFGAPDGTWLTRELYEVARTKLHETGARPDVNSRGNMGRLPVEQHRRPDCSCDSRGDLLALTVAEWPGRAVRRQRSEGQVGVRPSEP